MRSSGRFPGRALAALAALAVLGAWAPGCGETSASDAPRTIARDFWQALGTGRFEAARALSAAAGDATLRSLAAQHELREVVLGEVLRNETTALVETTAVVGRSDAPITFHTHLTRFDEGWKVDVTRSRRELTRAALLASVENVQDALRGSAEALADEIERSALEASEAVRDALQELEGDLRTDDAPPR